MARKGDWVAGEPYKKAVAVTKSDATALRLTEAVYVGGAGDLAVTMEDGSVVTFAGLAAGTGLELAVTKVMSTNTTATLIVALYRE